MLTFNTNRQATKIAKYSGAMAETSELQHKATTIWVTMNDLIDNPECEDVSLVYENVCFLNLGQLFRLFSLTLDNFHFDRLNFFAHFQQYFMFPDFQVSCGGCSRAVAKNGSVWRVKRFLARQRLESFTKTWTKLQAKQHAKDTP